MVTRIRQLLEHKQLSPTQFADLIGVGRPVMSHILSERNKPSLEVVKQISGAFPDISLPWLLFGTGEMLAGEAPATVIALINDLPVAPTPQTEAESPAATPLTAPALAAALPAPPEAVLRPFVPAQPVLAASPVVPSPVAVEPAVLSQPEPALASTPIPIPTPTASPAAAPSVPKPFKAARFVPASPLTPRSGSEAAAPLAAPAATAVSMAEQPASPSPVVSMPTTIPQGLPASANSDAAMLPFLAEPGKPIRRIVIFYRDGSFADYQPE